MKYEDKVRIATSEGIELEFALGGIGSRLCARLLDLLIQAALIVVAELIFASSVDDSSLAGAVVAVLGVVLGFAIIWTYDVLFETFNGGQTPGKRALGLRVVGEHGEPERFSTAAVRNLLRIVDEYLTLWLGALISMVRSERTQRIGDLTAGTLVVKDRAPPPSAESALSPSAREQLDGAASWDTTAITDQELSTTRYFLERRDEVAEHARDHLASELAAKLRPKVRGAVISPEDEEFLELLAAVKSRRGVE
jgi:uncharacterized RDD family membrane protein YckC